MAREYFKNLPNTTTPLRAERINGILNGEESIEKIVAGSIEGKNLFDKNNAYIVNGAFNAGTVNTLTNDTASTTIYIPCKPNTTYTISKTLGARFFVGYTTTTPASGVEVFGRLGANNSTEWTITTGSNAKYLVAYIYNSTVDSSLTLAQVLATVQIENGSSATEYDEYMKYGYNEDTNMGKVIVEKISGKNLFDKNTITIVQGSFSYINNSETTDSTRIRSDFFKIQPNTTYTISINSIIGEIGIVYKQNDNTTIIQGIGESTNNNYYTFTTPANAYYMRFRLGNGSNIKTAGIDYNIQIEKGTEATSYQDFNTTQMGSIVVDDILPTNLIPFEAVTTTSNGVTFTANADKTVKINGTATAQTDFTIGNVRLKAGQQYYLSGANGASSTTWFLNIQGVGNDSGNGFIYTPTQNENRRIFIRVKNGVTVNNAICTPKLNKGSSDRPFDAAAYVLWTNPAPTSNFTGQQITLNDDVSNYKYYEVIYRFSTTVSYMYSTGKIPMGLITILTVNNDTIRRRIISAISENKITFGAGQNFTTYGGTATDNNALVIPYQVIAYK